MKCGCYLLAFLLLLSYPGYSDVTLTDQEYNQVMTSIDNIEKENKLLMQDLTKAKSELALLKAVYPLLRDMLENQDSIFKQQETFYEKRLTARMIERTKDTGLGILIGLLLGVIYFTYAGQ